MKNVKKVTTALQMVRDGLAEYRMWRLRRERAHRLAEIQVNPAYVEQQKRLTDEYTRAKQAATPPPKQPAAESPPGSPLEPKNLLLLFRDTFNEWNMDKAPQLAAALAYYTIFSLAPLLIIVIALAGLALGQQQVQEAVLAQARGIIGEKGAEFILELIQGVRAPGAGVVATVVGLITLLLGAAGVFGQMKAALNTIWNVQPYQITGLRAGIVQFLKDQFLSFTMVLGIGFLLLVSLILSAILAAVSKFASAYVPAPAFQVLDFALSFVVITVLFAAIYKVLPDAYVAWTDVWIGAAITSLLFTIGRYLIGLYLGQSSITSSYGAAGSLVVILLWIYYSAQILFFGAEFTQVYANRFGSRITSRSAGRPGKAAQPAGV
jgi:membrane protein